MHDHLGDHGVVIRRDLVAVVRRRVHAHAVAAGQVHLRDGAGRRQEPAFGLLGVHAALDGVAAVRDVVLRERQRVARRHADHLFHEIGARDHLGDGVFHLDARVHLHEVVVQLIVQQKLDGARRRVAHGLRRAHGGFQHLVAHALRHHGRGAFLDHLLVVALHRAIALAQGHHGAVRIGDDLHLHVARVQHAALQVHGVVAERAHALALGDGELLGEVVLVVADAHALAATARRRLDHDGPADLACHRQRFLRMVHGLLRAGNHGHARLHHGLAGLALVAHAVQDLGRGADEHDVVLAAQLRERRVLRQEAVAGMDGLRAGALRGGQDGGDVQVRVARGGRADAHALVGQVHVQRMLVGRGVHGHRLDVHGAAGADDADGDLAAVGDEYLVEHGARRPSAFRRRRWPRGTAAGRIRPACRWLPAPPRRCRGRAW